MTTLSGIVEKVEHAMGLLEAAAAFLPGTHPAVALLRVLIRQSHETLAMSEVRVALAEVEADFSARAQAAADAWPEPGDKQGQ